MSEPEKTEETFTYNELVELAFNAIAAVESIDAKMLGERYEEMKKSIIMKSFDLINKSVNEVHEQYI